VSVRAVCGWCGEDYLNGRLHEDVGGIVDSLGAQLQDRRIAPLFGLVHILVDLLNKERNVQMYREIQYIIEILGPTCSWRVSMGCTNLRYNVELPFVAGERSQKTRATFTS